VKKTFIKDGIHSILHEVKQPMPTTYKKELQSYISNNINAEPKTEELEKLIKTIRSEIKRRQTEAIKKETDRKDLKQKVLEYIRIHDDGNGTGYKDIINGIPATEEDLEAAINEILTDGTAYEPRPGKIKVL